MSVESFAIATGAATRRRIGVTLAMSLLVVLLALVSLGIGAVRMSPLAVAQALFGGGSDVAQVIVREIRLPRMILGLSIGAILGLSGAALQGLLRNPLASPSLFGAPQSAAFGAVAVIALGLADAHSYALPVAAIAAAFGSVFALLTVAGRNAGLLILILAGLAISALAGAAWLSEVRLPKVAHFVDEGLKRLPDGFVEMLRVHGDLVCRGAAPVEEGLVGKVSEGSFLPVKGEDAGRKSTLEEVAVEVVVGLLKF